MKYLLLSALLICAAGATLAGSGPAVVPNNTDSGTSEGAIILLALVGMVIASGQLGGLATRNANKLEIEPAEADDNAGF